jgi:hypothetical protein
VGQVKVKHKFVYAWVRVIIVSWTSIPVVLLLGSLAYADAGSFQFVATFVRSAAWVVRYRLSIPGPLVYVLPLPWAAAANPEVRGSTPATAVGRMGADTGHRRTLGALTLKRPHSALSGTSMCHAHLVGKPLGVLPALDPRTSGVWPSLALDCRC